MPNASALTAPLHAVSGMLELAGGVSDLGGLISMVVVGLSVGGMALHKIVYAAKRDRREDAAGEVKQDFVESLRDELDALRKENRALLEKNADLRVKLATAEKEAEHHQDVIDMYVRTLGAK
jgi:hypothetical protein